MNINLLRNLDYYVGAPLCFLLNSANVLLKILLIKKSEPCQRKPNKILLIKLSEIGSIILSYPLISQIRSEYPYAEIHFLTFHKNVEIFRVFENIIDRDKIISINEQTMMTMACDIVKAIFKIRRLKIDVIFDLELFSRFTAIIAYLSAGQKIVGFYRYAMEGLYRGNFLTHKIAYNPFLHISRHYLAFLNSIKQDEKLTPETDSDFLDIKLTLPCYKSKLQTKTKIQDILSRNGILDKHKIVFLNPGEGSLPLREWPLENFITLGNNLLKNEDIFIILVGLDGAYKKGEMLYKKLKDQQRCLNLINQTTIEEALELFSIGKALIANDCGLAHLGSLVNINKFIFFGPESPNLYSPLDKKCSIFYKPLACSPCLSAFNHRKSACIDNLCLKRISPEIVYKKIITIL
ncbi:MAG: glycosyltransferase family 9 protein [Candidatus Omnitrophota bacterium]